jgi:hypothetical protein
MIKIILCFAIWFAGCLIVLWALPLDLLKKDLVTFSKTLLKQLKRIVG